MKYLVAGNYTRFAVTLTQKSGELITPYIPTEGDVVQISLYGARRFDYPNYTQAQNVLTFEDNGCLNVGLYCLEVKITEANTHKLRCMYREQIRVVASNDDVPTDASFSDDDVQLSGQFDIVASAEIVVDDELSLTSTNPVQNKVVTQELKTKYDEYEKVIYPYAIDLYFLADGEYVAEWYIESATTTAAGLMSAADKTKLDALPTNENLQTALNAKGGTLAGGLSAAGYEIELKSGNTSLSYLTIPYASSQTEGLMIASDYAKLDALPTNSDLQTVLNTKGGTLAGGLSAAGYEIELKSGNTTLSAVYIDFATSQIDGLMSASDYSKLAALPTNADLTTALNGKQATLTWDTVPTQNSTNPVTSGGLYVVLGDIESVLDNILGN